MKKYELLLDSSIEVMGIRLYRIRALIKFGSVKVGELGGYVESEKNLDQDHGNAWVYGNARVSGDAWVYGNARVSGDARVYGNARVYGDAQVSGDARVYGDAQVSGDAQVYGDEVTQSPYNLIGLHWDVTITRKFMQIGCERHTHAEWREFKDSHITYMDAHALEFWGKYRDLLLTLCDDYANKGN